MRWDSSSASPSRAGWPPGIPYIVGNEAAERFSFYGMRAILYVHLVAVLLGFRQESAVAAGDVGTAKLHATEIVHLFMAGVYAFPMLGALVADRWLGKYRVILWVSLVYCLGHAVLAVWGDTEKGMFAGLALIAFGSGGIKPCVSANVGDQFTSANSHLVNAVFQIFYFSVNFGSFFSTLLTPFLLRKYGYEVAFGVPGVLMGVATLVFWLGRHRFVHVPPQPGGRLGALDALASALFFVPFIALAFFANAKFEGGGVDAYLKHLWHSYWPHYAVSIAALVAGWMEFQLLQTLAQDRGFLSVLLYALTHQRERQPGSGFFDVARAKFGDEAAEGPPAVLRIMLVFSMVSVFWALFDQHSSTWIEQAKQMDRHFGASELAESQIPAMNPALVMLVIPALQFGLFRPLERRGRVVKPLVRMTVGMFVSALSFVAVALIQRRIAAVGVGQLHVAWQLVPYLLITTGEVLVSVTGLEFAYTQAPRAMKSTILGFWLLTVTVGNLLVALLAPLQKGRSLEEFFWLFAALMAIAACIFVVLAWFYRGRAYVQDGQ